MAVYTPNPAEVGVPSIGNGIQSVIYAVAVTAGQAVWKNGDKWEPLDPNSDPGPTRNSDIGIALSSGDAGQTGSVANADGLEINIGASAGGAAADVVIAHSAVPGGIKPWSDIASGEKLIRLGDMIDAVTLKMNREITGATRA